MEKKQVPQDVQEYLNKIRRTVSESQALIDAANLRIAETDRLLAANGMTRDDLKDWHPTGEQRLAINEFLRSNGLPTLEEDETQSDFDSITARIRAERAVNAPPLDDTPIDQTETTDDITDQRQRKFNNFMQRYRL